MSDRAPNDTALGHLALSLGVRAHAHKLLASIRRADTQQALFVISGRAMGFCEALEVLRALTASDLEGLYMTLEAAGLQRHKQLQEAQ